MRGATQNCEIGDEQYKISIHAPREGSDGINPAIYDNMSISIHAPREGSDFTGAQYTNISADFNPRSP